ncbi:MAG: hypothetical protein A2189_08020 [Paenibacillus sp. RIFOXYA1_FULL_44_5]|nr:MAG: hypothetical protein A2189_08020 [Paenibacillus sp. RIFOXYA1_FULL_44_5]
MRKIKTLVYLVISSLMIVSFLSACGTKDTASNSDIKEGGPAYLVKTYGTMAELAKDAKEIVEIEVNSQETITYSDIPFTISTVSVLKSFKGDHKKGDTIRIIETGGEFTPLDKQGNPLPKATMKFAGIPVLEPKEHDVIFLNAFKGPQISGEAYVPLGVYQGRFKVDASGDMVQQAPDKEKVKDIPKTKVDKFSDVLNNLPKQ